MMELTRKGEYAIRGVIYLAQIPPGTVALISEIAAATDVPQTFLVKIRPSFQDRSALWIHFGVPTVGYVTRGPPQ